MNKETLQKNCYTSLQCLYLVVDEVVAQEVFKNANEYIKFLENKSFNCPDCGSVIKTHDGELELVKHAS